MPVFYGIEKIEGYEAEDDPYVTGNQKQSDKAFYRRLYNELSDLCFEECLTYSISDEGMTVKFDVDFNFHNQLVNESADRIAREYRLNSLIITGVCGDNAQIRIYFSNDIKPGLIL